MAQKPQSDTARVGRTAPDFEVACATGPGESGRVARLADYRDRWLILMFYPRDFSLVCPTELSAVNQRYQEFTENGAEVLAISTDTVETHERWITTPPEQGGLGPIRFPLGGDPDGKVSRAYNVYLEPGGVALRGLFIIDPNSVMQFQVIHNLNVGRRTDDILRVLRALKSGGLCPESWSPGSRTLDPSSLMVPGNIVAHYRVEEKLADGGFAAVFRAFDQQLRRPVAVKILKEGKERMPGIEHEARAAAALNHPNVCTVHSINDTAGVLMLVMEYLEGQTLAGTLETGALQKKQALGIARQIAAGMAGAHEAGIVHGDLKPANIMITGQGTAKILDFGLAVRRQVNVSGESTQSLDQRAGTFIAGTPGYMSPEQVAGHSATAASDVFSFGLILHEMLTGDRSAQDLNILQSLERIRAIEPDTLAADVDEPFCSLLRSTLVADPAHRRITMHEIEATLREEEKRTRG